MDHLHTRLDVLERQVQTLHQPTRTVTRHLRWWRGVAGGLLVLAVLTWALPTGTAQEKAPAGERERLVQRLAALEQLRPLLRHLTIAPDAAGRPEVRITGANLRLVNGLGRTGCTDAQGEPMPDCTNGLGNVIIGYNEPREIGGPDIRTGSHNLIIGKEHNFSRSGGLVVGLRNEISGDWASVSGGHQNTASGEHASVSGGCCNTARGEHASVSGGDSNTASGANAAVSGGSAHLASGFRSWIGGGDTSQASGTFAVVSGGWNNIAASVGAVVSGGTGNIASGEGSSVSGGQFNTASGDRSSVSGGQQNTASGDWASVSGGRNRTAEGELDWVAGSLFEDD